MKVAGNDNAAARWPRVSARTTTPWRPCAQSANAPCRHQAQGFYHELLRSYYVSILAPGRRVLELGCGAGDLLAAVRPSHGTGVDIRPEVIDTARRRHPDLEFRLAKAETYESNQRFDYIILSDLVNEVYDVDDLLVHVRNLAHPRTRLIINFYNHLWRPALTAAEWIGAKSPSPPQNWFSTSDMANLLHLAGWELIKTDAKVLWPLYTPIWATFCNRWLAPLLRHLCLVAVQIARLEEAPGGSGGTPRRGCASSMSGTQGTQIPPCLSCSVIVPARNEAGTIEAVVARMPQLGERTEIIFVEGGSSDSTWMEIQRVARLYPERDIKILKQDGSGKGQAVRQGFAAATGDLLVVLDADLSVLPEELTKFYDVAKSGKGEFINGVRLVYPMGHRAMRFVNMVGNKFFSTAFGFLLGQRVKDTLCGTKALFRTDYEAIAENRSCFGDFDPFGDFDLLFGASKLNLRIVDLPVHYQTRTYGQTNIQRWRHGWLLLRMVLFAARRLKFV